MYRYISDLHLYHNRILQLTDRPYASIEEMHNAIIDGWKKTVSRKDTVIIAGDVSMYHPKETADILNSLPGRKILVTGNHDRFNLENAEFRKAFHKILPYMQLDDNGRKVEVFHYPIEEWNGFFRGFYHLHGHVHNNDVPAIPRRYNICLDKIGPAPLTLDEIIGSRDVILEVDSAISLGCGRCMYPVSITCDGETLFTDVMCIENNYLYVMQNADGRTVYASDGVSVGNISDYGISEDYVVSIVRKYRGE